LRRGKKKEEARASSHKGYVEKEKDGRDQENTGLLQPTRGDGGVKKRKEWRTFSCAWKAAPENNTYYNQEGRGLSHWGRGHQPLSSHDNDPCCMTVKGEEKREWYLSRKLRLPHALHREKI